MNAELSPDDRFYEWLLSDHPAAVLERARRRLDRRGGAGDGVRSGAPFDLRIEGLRRGIDIASVPRFMGAAHDLYVLPRHRLVPQPHGFEGLCPVAVGLEADGPSVAHGPDPSRADACFQAADPAARALQEEDQISVPPNVADLV